MSAWYDLIVGTLEIAPEIKVLVNIIGAMYLLEVVTAVVALLGGLRR